MVKEVEIKDVISVNEIIDKLMLKELPGSVSFDLAMFYNECKKIVESYNKSRDQIIKKYGTKKDNGVFVEPNSKEHELCVTELNEILIKKVDFQFTPLNKEEIKKINLTPKDVLNLLNFMGNE